MFELRRSVAFAALAGEMREWSAHRVFPKRLKAFGLDAAKIVDAAVPTPKSPEAGSVPTGKKRKASAAKPAKSGKKGKA